MDKFLEMLTANNITTGEFTTKRPKQRAYLLHFSAEVKNGTTAPKDVPKEDGVDIIWDHGDDAKSKKAAGEMVDAFGIVGPAALISNHIAGNAIDMKFDFTKMVKDKDGNNTITYKKDGKEYLLVANSARGVMKVSMEEIGTVAPITARVGGIAGLKYETIKELSNVRQLDKLNEQSAVLLVAADGGEAELKTIALP